MPVCLVCSKRAYSAYCTVHKPRKPISRQGKHYNLWQKTRREFIKRNPNNICDVCGGKATDIDHIKTRGSRPDLRYELSNLRWICRNCHNNKHNA